MKKYQEAYHKTFILVLAFQGWFFLHHADAFHSDVVVSVVFNASLQDFEIRVQFVSHSQHTVASNLFLHSKQIKHQQLFLVGQFDRFSLQSHNTQKKKITKNEFSLANVSFWKTKIRHVQVNRINRIRTNHFFQKMKEEPNELVGGLNFGTGYTLQTKHFSKPKFLFGTPKFGV